MAPSMINGEKEGQISLMGDLHPETKRNILSN